MRLALVPIVAVAEDDHRVAVASNHQHSTECGGLSSNNYRQ